MSGRISHFYCKASLGPKISERGICANFGGSFYVLCLVRWGQNFGRGLNGDLSLVMKKNLPLSRFGGFGESLVFWVYF